MQYLKYFENYNKEGLVKKFYENALHHDDVNALQKVSNKYNTNPLNYINTKDIIEYNAGNIFEYLFDDLEIDLSKGYLNDNIISKGKFQIVKILYNNNYFKDRIENLTQIDIHGVGYITTLDGIEIFSNLEELFCAENQISSLEPLKYLRNLKIIHCNDNQIQSLEPLKKHSQLTRLHFADNKIRSIKPIEHLLSELEAIVIVKNPLNEESQELLKKYRQN